MNQSIKGEIGCPLDRSSLEFIESVPESGQKAVLNIQVRSAPGPMKGAERYSHQFWEDEGPEAFEAYVKRKSEPAEESQ